MSLFWMMNMNILYWKTPSILLTLTQWFFYYLTPVMNTEFSARNSIVPCHFHARTYSLHTCNWKSVSIQLTSMINGMSVLVEWSLLRCYKWIHFLSLSHMKIRAVGFSRTYKNEIVFMYMLDETRGIF